MTTLEPVQIDVLPQSIEEFLALRDQIAQTPQGGAAMMIIALLIYAGDQALGRQYLTAAIDRERLQQGPDGYKGWEPRTSDLQLIQSQISGKPHIVRTYIKGTTPEDGYQMPAPPYVLEFSDSPHSGDPDSEAHKIFVTSSGAAHPRPVMVKENNRGIWKAFEWSSLIVGVQEPESPVDDDV